MRTGAVPALKRRRLRSKPQAMGDIFCLEGDCVVGKQLVNEMQAVFKQGVGFGVNELSDQQVEFRRRFSPTVTQLVEQFQAEDGKLSRQVPFSLVCCTIKDIGVKAQSITRQMRDFMNVAQPDATPVESPHKSGTDPISKTINSVLKGAFLLGAGYLGFTFVANRISKR
jgi:hypothetical protein